MIYQNSVMLQMLRTIWKMNMKKFTFSDYHRYTKMKQIIYNTSFYNHKLTIMSTLIN